MEFDIQGAGIGEPIRMGVTHHTPSGVVVDTDKVKKTT